MSSVTLKSGIHGHVEMSSQGKTLDFARLKHVRTVD